MRARDVEVLGLRPFVPAKDFALSRRFYAAVGFEEEFATAEIAGLRAGGARFLLQNFYVQAFAENLMLQLLTPDPDAWFARIERLDLPSAFGVRAPIAPQDREWARVAMLFDPSGVLWHVTKADA